jgi:hypothetical protein
MKKKHSDQKWKVISIFILKKKLHYEKEKMFSSKWRVISISDENKKSEIFLFFYFLIYNRISTDQIKILLLFSFLD